MIIHFEDKIKEWYNEGEPINKMLLGGYVIYQRLTDCSPKTDKLYRWITLSGDTDYICQNFNKYEKQQKQYSEDSGATWVDFRPPIYRAGELIEAESEDCGYVPRDYRWINIDPRVDYYCVETTKYYKQKRQYSEDGIHWIDVIPYEYKRGDIAEEKSTDCGYIEPQYREISGDPYCNGVDKVFDLMNQVSYDGGITWITTSTVMTLIEKNSEDCGYVPPEPIYRWVNLDPATDFYCSGTTKMYKQQKQYSTDNGETWKWVEPAEYREGGVAETKSTDCGYLPANTKWYATYPFGYTKYALCDGNYELAKKDITTSNIRTVVIGDCIKTIADSVFQYCGNLKSASIGSGVTTIADNVFNVCSHLTSVTFKEGIQLKKIGNNVFRQCLDLVNIDLPDSLTSIGYRAFENCNSLESIVIPDNVISIGDSIFEFCSSLTSCTIGNGITSISKFAFSNCTSMTGITIPIGVKNIGAEAFQDCSSLTEIVCLPVIPPTMNVYAFGGTNAPIYVPDESVEAYKTAQGVWYHYADRIRPLSEKP